MAGPNPLDPVNVSLTDIVFADVIKFRSLMGRLSLIIWESPKCSHRHPHEGGRGRLDPHIEEKVSEV